jgi:hypothetical protein
MVECKYNPSHSGGRGSRISILVQPRKSYQGNLPKKKKIKLREQKDWGCASKGQVLA